MKRKLIEVSLPLEAINKQAAREKSIRHGHPSTLHLWWARRPLAAARAVLFAQLVDDPSACPEEFASEDDQRRERERLHEIVERLADWDNVRDEKLLAEAHAEILKSTGGAPPTILDPFAGGGTIPLEAQRLGLDVQASDLNPVAVLINKALIEIPAQFRDQPPVFPGLAEAEIRNWKGAEGLAADVRAYGQWMRDLAEEGLGPLYPQADGKTVIAWLWARTITCPNPACGVEMPLARSWWLGKKRGKQAYVVPSVVADQTHPSGKRVEFSIGTDSRFAPASDKDGTVGRQGAVCVACGSATDLKVVRAMAAAGGLGRRLMAIVAEGDRQRVYLAPSTKHAEIADEVAAPRDAPAASLPDQALGFRVQAYGFKKWADLFTSRQLHALVTFSDMVALAREKVIADGGTAGYADAVATFLGFGVSKATDYHNALCAWRSDIKNEGIGHLFSRQAIPMVWDYCEANPLSSSSGNMRDQWTWVAKSLESLVPAGAGTVAQADAASRSYDGVVVSTDPPYYDNIDYSDLSDFFYVWLRRSLRSIYPELLSTLLVPKDEELVANPFRHDGPAGAKAFFENGFRSVFSRVCATADSRFPITVYYAFKQTESEAGGDASTGWETLLEGMVRSGWVITSTWPMRSELGNRMRSIDSNALASSIVLSLRPRPEDAPVIDRRGYLDLLRDELPPALADLQRAAIAPVDLAQAAIGPGMALFSRYARVVEPAGSSVSVREALRLINSVLAEVLSDQEGDFDKDTRWCVKWFETHGFDKAAYGGAETLAAAYNTSVAGLDRSGAVYAKAGEVRLLTTAELPTAYRPERDEHITLWEIAMHLAKALDESGLAEAGRILDGASARVDVEAVKELAYLVFSLAEKRSMVQVAGMFNALVTSWPEVTAAARAHASAAPRATEQAMLALDDELGD
ncbi:DUF1156 domain-containing protein [Phycicoccus flavus]|uniref:DUF1156 domain-containing protein n=1 Tax=Phycicoccus flavus TaxID=2502783 RepID=UPI000FEBB7EB|nr:DUF1156 domain-containing protein [Phycicoccus flavus]NHA68756.1 DUF1156 domain-containing protein [Phycicoccus flavus]